MLLSAFMSTKVMLWLRSWFLAETPLFELLGEGCVKMVCLVKPPKSVIKAEGDRNSQTRLYRQFLHIFLAAGNVISHHKSHFI